MNVGEITLWDGLGGYEIDNLPVSKLPQEVATAMVAVNVNLYGATFEPIWYIGHQLVNGVNYMFIAKEIRSTKERNTSIVALVVNVPPGDTTGAHAKIVEIIEEADLPKGVNLAFEIATKQLLGVSYKPILYVGNQVVRGINHYIVCEAKGIYPGAQPYAVLMVINVFETQVSVVDIRTIQSDFDPDTARGLVSSLGHSPLGEWP